MVLEKTVEIPLDCKEIQPVLPKGDQSWVFIGRTDAEADRVPAPLAGRGSTTARGNLRLCPASVCQTGLPWSSPPA